MGRGCKLCVHVDVEDRRVSSCILRPREVSRISVEAFVVRRMPPLCPHLGTSVSDSVLSSPDTDNRHQPHRRTAPQTQNTTTLRATVSSEVQSVTRLVKQIHDGSQARAKEGTVLDHCKTIRHHAAQRNEASLLTSHTGR